VCASYTVSGLHTQLKAHVLLRVQEPVIAGGRDVEHQPASVSGSHLFPVQEKRFRIPKETGRTHCDLHYILTLPRKEINVKQ